MNKCIMTVCTSDYYQYYIPIFIWSIFKTWDNVDIKIYLRGMLNSDVKAALNIISLRNDYRRVSIKEDYKTNYPYNIGTTNALRFTTRSIRYEETLITDIDFFFSKMPMDIFTWFRNHHENMRNGCYSGVHGPWKKPPRPEICPSWTGNFQRIAGGFFVAYPPWWEMSYSKRRYWDLKLKYGTWGMFRESDEVMLYRIIKECDLPVAKRVPFPRFLRHLHFGDFKPEMRTRFENKEKMVSLLDTRAINSLLVSIQDKDFSRILEIVRKNKIMDEIIGRTIDYCSKRKNKG